MINIFKLEMERAILNPLFFATTIITCFLFFFSGYEEFYIYAPQSENIDVLHFFDFLRNVGVFETMIIICCTIPYSTSFYIDYTTSYIKLIKYRTTENKLIISKFIACAISGGLSIMLGVLLFVSVVALKYPLVNTLGGAYQSAIMRLDYSPQAFDILLLNGKYLSYFVINMYLIFLVGALWSVVGMLISLVIANPFVAMFSPYLLYFSQDYFINTKNLPRIINTSSIIKSQFYFDGVFVNLIISSLIIFAIMCILFAMFVYFFKRRCE